MKIHSHYPGALLIGVLILVVIATSLLVLLRSNLLVSQEDAPDGPVWRTERVRKLLGVAFAALEEQKPENAIEPLQAILEDYPTQRTALSLLGQAYYRTRQYSLAADYFRKLLSFSPNDAAAHNNLGQVFVKMNRLDDALSEFNKALKADPNQPMVLLNLSSLYALRGERQNSMDYYSRAVEIWNGTPPGKQPELLSPKRTPDAPRGK